MSDKSKGNGRTPSAKMLNVLRSLPKYNKVLEEMKKAGFNEDGRVCDHGLWFLRNRSPVLSSGFRQ